MTLARHQIVPADITSGEHPARGGAGAKALRSAQATLVPLAVKNRVPQAVKLGRPASTGAPTVVRPMASGMSFDQVLEAARSGEEWAFTCLYDQLNPALVRYFAARVPREADDLVADTWLGVARGLSRFEGDAASLRRWLFTIAHRRLADHWYEQGRGSPEPVDPSTLDGADPGSGPESAVVDFQSAQAVLEQIGAVLTRDQAEVVFLRLLGGLSVEEVAEIMGKPPGTVRVLQHRALRKLSREYAVEGVTP